MPVSKSKRSRYTPPPPKKAPSSPLWVPSVMFALLLTGTAVIVTNYLGILPGQQQNVYLLVGLVELVAGFVLATVYR